MSQRVYRLGFSIVRGTKGCDIRLKDQSDLCVTAENPPPPENGGSPLSFGQESRKPVAIRDTRSIDLVNFRNSEFSKISASRIPHPRKCPVKGPYTDTENDRLPTWTEIQTETGLSRATVARHVSALRESGDLPA